MPRYEIKQILMERRKLAVKVKSIRIENYKGFGDSGEISLSPDFNLVVGPNNSGKTAFIEGFRFNRNQAMPHRSIHRPEEVEPPRQSAFYGEFEFEKGEFQKMASRTQGGFSLQLPNRSSQAAQDIISRISDGFIARLKALSSSSPFSSVDFPSHGLFSNTDDRSRAEYVVDEGGNIKVIRIASDANDNLPHMITEFIQHCVRLAVDQQGTRRSGLIVHEPHEPHELGKVLTPPPGRSFVWFVWFVDENDGACGARSRNFGDPDQLRYRERNANARGSSTGSIQLARACPFMRVRSPARTPEAKSRKTAEERRTPHATAFEHDHPLG